LETVRELHKLRIDLSYLKSQERQQKRERVELDDKIIERVTGLSKEATEEDKRLRGKLRHRQQFTKLVRKVIAGEEKGVLLSSTIGYLTTEGVKRNLVIEDPKGFWNTETRMILHYVAKTFFSLWKKMKPNQKELFDSLKAINRFCEEMAKVDKEMIDLIPDIKTIVTINPTKLRNEYGLDPTKFTNKKLREIALSIPDIVKFKGYGRIYLDVKSSEYRKVYFNHPICGVVAVEGKGMEQHTGKKRQLIRFEFFSRLGLVFVAGALHGCFNIMVDNYFQLRPTVQNIGLIASWQSRPSWIGQRQVAELLEIKDENPTTAKATIIKSARDAVEEGVIEGWDTKGKGWKREFKFTPIKWERETNKAIVVRGN